MQADLEQPEAGGAVLFDAKVEVDAETIPPPFFSKPSRMSLKSRMSEDVKGDRVKENRKYSSRELLRGNRSCRR
jgi:hypothetical protein